MTVPALMVLVICLLRAADAKSNSHFNNHLVTNVHATTFYATSKFTNRNIPPGGSGTPHLLM